LLRVCFHVEPEQSPRRKKKGASQFPEKRRSFEVVAGARYGTWTKAITAPFRVELAA
jgi:hypothetical protein